MKRMSIGTFAMKYFGIKLPKHQKIWVKFLMKSGKRCILLAPRGHGKTTIINLIYLAWIIAHDPGIHILIVSNSREMGESFSRSVRDVFEHEDIQRDFNLERGTPWKAGEWKLKSDIEGTKSTLRVIGVMGRMTGWRGDMVIFDDVLEIKAISSEATRVKIDNWIHLEVLPALNPSPKEKVIVIGTRKHPEDWYGKLLRNPNYDSLVNKAWVDDEKTIPLWPEVFTPEVLSDRLIEYGPMRFAQEMMNEPAPPEGYRFKIENMRRYEHLPDVPLEYYMGVDPSHGVTTGKSLSYFSFTVIAYDPKAEKSYVVEMFRAKVSPEQQVVICSNTIEKYKPKLVSVESVFKYSYVYEQLRDKFPHVEPVDYMHTKMSGTTAVNKTERIENLIGPMIERGEVLFLKPGLDPFTDMFIEYEYIMFPTGSMDMFDALNLTVHKLKSKPTFHRSPFIFGRRR